MAVTELFYRERADEARLQADESNLANVRERCLRSAAAWDIMAARISRTTRQRVATEERKAAEREAALLAEPEAAAPAAI
ncbi:MAG TPA: hypothetical protein VLK25_08275 [Allosphingosinicella sp.]|nr:hypothetical protein [Allosphingosinicella sp.]